MATTYASPYSGMASQPFQLPTADSGYRAKMYVMRCIVTYASQAAADIVKLCMYPKGAIPAGFELTTSVSTGSSTIAIGNATTPAKYKAAGAVTTVDVPLPTALTSSLGNTPLTADEEVILTFGTASAPASGQLTVDAFYYGI